jgi:hypothetical protein
VAFPKIAFPDDNKDSADIFLVIAQSGASAKDLFFKHLDHRTEIPLHPFWSYWLWEILLQKGWLIPLKTLVGDYQGYLVEIEKDELIDLPFKKRLSRQWLSHLKAATDPFISQLKWAVEKP